MDKAKAAVQDFVSSSGKHKTTVDESVAPAVTNEHIKPHRHENVTTAIDREVHQDHHHTTVQPVNHRETLPEKHEHNIIPVKHTTHEHGNAGDVKAKLEQEAAQFKHSSTTHETTHSTATAPTVEGERVHHHVHEHVQPVVHKETVQPHVVHTTVPIHETHHAAAQHHGISTLPAKTLDEFKTAGGLLDGKGSTHHGEYDGCPRPYNKSLQQEQTEGDRNMHTHTGIGHHSHDHHTTGTGMTGNNGMTSNTGMTGDRGMTGTTGNTGMTGTGAGYGSGHSSGLNAGPHNSKLANEADPRVDHDLDQTTKTNKTGTKPSLMDRLNPMKDSDHDGKKGFND